MKVVVGHHLWSRVGGGELVNAYVVKTLMGAGHEVAVVSSSSFSKESYEEWFGIDLRGVKVYSLLPRMLPLFGIYQRLGFYIPLERAIKKECPEMVFLDNELYKPILKLKERSGFRLLEYIHFPFHALWLERGFGKIETAASEEDREALERYLEDTRIYHKRYEKGWWKYYFKLWLRLYKKVARDNPFEVADAVMANSRYIARLTKILWQGDALVLNPPVKIRDFDPYNGKGFEERDDAVIMIGRISPEKRYEDAIEAIALTETKPTLRIVGGLIPSNIPYKERIERLAKERNFRLEFYINASRSDVVKMATSSKVFVHTTVGEHFGVAVVEGMAAGCPVIVHRTGGPYEDITDHGRYGLHYEAIENLAEGIDKLMTDGDAWKHYHDLSLKRAKDFDEEVFANKFLKVVEKIVENA